MFGTAYAIKIAVNNAMTIILRIVAGVLQDQDNNSFDRVVIIYVVLSGCWHCDACHRPIPTSIGLTPMVEEEAHFTR